jgi:hypothetical protein
VAVAANNLAVGATFDAKDDGHCTIRTDEKYSPGFADNPFSGSVVQDSSTWKL